MEYLELEDIWKGIPVRFSAQWLVEGPQAPRKDLYLPLHAHPLHHSLAFEAFQFQTLKCKLKKKTKKQKTKTVRFITDEHPGFP